jgi:hypothetical protein
MSNRRYIEVFSAKLQRHHIVFLAEFKKIEMAKQKSNRLYKADLIESNLPSG